MATVTSDDANGGTNESVCCCVMRWQRMSPSKPSDLCPSFIQPVSTLVAKCDAQVASQPSRNVPAEVDDSSERDAATAQPQGRRLHRHPFAATVLQLCRAHRTVITAHPPCCAPRSAVQIHGRTGYLAGPPTSSSAPRLFQPNNLPRRPFPLVVPHASLASSVTLTVSVLEVHSGVVAPRSGGLLSDLRVVECVANHD